MMQVSAVDCPTPECEYTTVILCQTRDYRYTYDFNRKDFSHKKMS